MQVLTIGNNFPSSFNSVFITSKYISIKIYLTRSIFMLHTIISEGKQFLKTIQNFASAKNGLYLTQQ